MFLFFLDFKFICMIDILTRQIQFFFKTLNSQQTIYSGKLKILVNRSVGTV